MGALEETPSLPIKGDFSIWGIQISFTKSSNRYTFISEKYPQSFCGVIRKSLDHLVESITKSRIINYISLSKIHVLVHELGHAIAFKILFGTKPHIELWTDRLGGATHSWHPSNQDQFPIENKSIKGTICSLAGPLADMLFSSIKLVAGVALKSYCWPIAAILAGGSLFIMAGELFYASHSVVNSNDGDFGRIARNGKMHLIVSTALLVGQAALGVFLAAALM